MKLSFRNKGLQVFDAASLLEEARDVEEQHRQSGNPSASLRIVSLDLSHNRLQRFIGSSCLAHVTELDLSHNNLSKLPELPPSLNRLVASHNGLTTITGCRGCESLTFVDLRNNRLVDESLEALPPNISTLQLSDNQIRSAHCILHILKLLKVGLENNHIRKLQDVACLGGLKYLRHISLKGNVVTQNAKLIAALKSSISKLTTLDNVTLAQAESNRIYQHTQAVKAADAAKRQSAIASARERIQRTQSDPRDDIELQRMEARVEELERLLRAEKLEGVELQKTKGRLGKQLAHLESLDHCQRADIAEQLARNERVEEQKASLLQAVGSLGSAFGSYRAQIVGQRSASRHQ